MEEAFLVTGISQERVKAENCQHSDFGNIFQCIYCDGTLKLTKPHLKLGSMVKAYFSHMNGDPNCAERVLSYDGSASSSLSSFVPRGQSTEKLERIVLECLHHYLSRQLSFYSLASVSLSKYNSNSIQIFVNEEHLRRQIRSNRISPIPIHPNINLLLKTASQVLQSDCCSKYLKSKILDFEKQLRLNPIYLNDFIEHQKLRNFSIDWTVKRYCKMLDRFIKYFQSGSSEKFRKNFVEGIILGDTKLTFPVDYLWKVSEIDILRNYFSISINCDEDSIKRQRNSERNKLSKFEVTLLQLLYSDPKFLNQAFIDFYSNPSSPSPEVRFIRFILSKFWKSIKFYDWHFIYELYNS
jgi:hypothetical protein